MVALRRPCRHGSTGTGDDPGIGSKYRRDGTGASRHNGKMATFFGRVQTRRKSPSHVLDVLARPLAVA
eukprot:m.176528 g.176528  ORF g.176528 m.176528 type:complete len:68 (-) comp16801_c0_seq1:62-265(-)